MDRVRYLIVVSLYVGGLAALVEYFGVTAAMCVFVGHLVLNLLTYGILGSIAERRKRGGYVGPDDTDEEDDLPTRVALWKVEIIRSSEPDILQLMVNNWLGYKRGDEWFYLETIAVVADQSIIERKYCAVIVYRELVVKD